MGCGKQSRLPPPPPPQPPPPVQSTTHPDSIHSLLEQLDSKANSPPSQPLPQPPPRKLPHSSSFRLLFSSTDSPSPLSRRSNGSGGGIVGGLFLSSVRRANGGSSGETSGKRRNTGENSVKSQQRIVQAIMGPTKAKQRLTVDQIMDHLLRREEQTNSRMSPAITRASLMGGTGSGEKRVLRTWSSFLMPIQSPQPQQQQQQQQEDNVSSNGELLTAREVWQMPLPPTTVHTKTVLQFLEAENDPGQTEEEEEDDLLDSGELQQFISERSRDQTWNAKSLGEFMYSEFNQASNLKRLQSQPDWTRPLTEYFISTSHNTYLFGGQWVYYGGRVDINMYSNAIRLGCRCVEIDLYDGDNGEPTVTHSNAAFAGGQCSFLDVCMLLSSEAFGDNRQVPLLLNLENNMKTNSKRAAEILIQAFGERLVACDDEILGWAIHSPKQPFHASPQELFGRVLCRSKTREAHADFQRLIYYRNAHLPVQPCMAKFYQTSSFSEGKAKKAFKKIDNLVGVNQQLLCRIYPRSSAVLSQNYAPLPFWLLGFQLVALNFQTDGLDMDLNQCMFSQTGGSGFVLKPYLFRRRKKSDGRKRMQQSLLISTASSPMTSVIREEDNGEVIHPSFMRIMEDGLDEEEENSTHRSHHPRHQPLSTSPQSVEVTAPRAFTIKLMSQQPSKPIATPEKAQTSSLLIRDDSNASFAEQSVAMTFAPIERRKTDPPSTPIPPPPPLPPPVRSAASSDCGESSFMKRVHSFNANASASKLRSEFQSRTFSFTDEPEAAPPPKKRSIGGTARNRRSSTGAIMLEGMLAVISSVGGGGSSSNNGGEAARRPSKGDETECSNGGVGDSNNGEHGVLGQDEEDQEDLVAAPEETTSLSFASLTVVSCRCVTDSNPSGEALEGLTLELTVDGQHHLDRFETRIACRAGEQLCAVFKDSISALLTLRLLKRSHESPVSSSTAATAVGTATPSASSSPTTQPIALASRSFFAHCIQPLPGHQQVVLVGEHPITKFQQVFVLVLECKTSIIAPLFPSPPPPLYCPSQLSMILCTVISCRAEPEAKFNLAGLDPFVSVQVLGIPRDARETRTPLASHCKLINGDGSGEDEEKTNGNEVSFGYPLVLPLAWSEMAFVRFSLVSTNGQGLDLCGLPVQRKRTRIFATKRMFGGASLPPPSSPPMPASQLGLSGTLSLPPTPLASLASAAVAGVSSSTTPDTELVGRQVLCANAIRSGYRSVALVHDKLNIHVATLLCHFALFTSQSDTFPPYHST
ncbi:hypothetical protein BASA81_006699 [Batrachochytrium salamandrivorans]|nr:hypothetical protein BASA81_006699 [Batrachochytrium salamandrivorans]